MIYHYSAVLPFYVVKASALISLRLPLYLFFFFLLFYLIICCEVIPSFLATITSCQLVEVDRRKAQEAEKTVSSRKLSRSPFLGLLRLAVLGASVRVTRNSGNHKFLQCHSEGFLLESEEFEISREEDFLLLSINKMFVRMESPWEEGVRVSLPEGILELEEVAR